MKNIARLATVILLMALIAQPAHAAGIFRIKFGYVDQLDGKLVVYHDTRKIAKDKSKDFGFGYTVESSNHNFSTYCILIPPSPLHFKSDEDRYQAIGIRSETINADEGYAIVRFKMDDTDPIGEYRIDVFVNDEKRKSINFIVVSK